MTLPELTEGTLRELLDSEAARINSPAFIADDPVQFPRRFSRQPDIEIAALLASAIAWGNRRMICRDADRMLAMLDNRPHDFVMDEAYEELPDGNIHRTFFTADLRAYLRGLQRIYSRYATLEEFARANGVERSPAPAWALAEAINAELAAANNQAVCTDPSPGRPSRCLPQNLRTTALKRLNMALRWLVRRDGIVDLGVWSLLDPSQLYIPLDVHVGNVSRQLGLLTRKNDDRRAVDELTASLRRFRPDDPVIYDYALFGIGIGIK
ncbi:MAG: TIGR02757 family protein [Muribaculaceae bacterium]|nr:TIGR02757 family protein [Muribaculaceae bacterium]